MGRGWRGNSRRRISVAAGNAWLLVVNSRRTRATPTCGRPPTPDQRPAAEKTEHIAGTGVTFLLHARGYIDCQSLWNPLRFRSLGHEGMLCAAALSHIWLRFAMFFGELPPGYSSFNSFLQLGWRGGRMRPRAHCGALYWTPRGRRSQLRT